MTERGFIRNYSTADAVQTSIRVSRSAVRKVIHASKAGLAVAACLFVSVAVAQSNNSFPKMPVDAKTVRVQNQAEEVYNRTDYERAFFIYRKELAPIGDKYGQYMVGFMYLTGKGVEEDRIAASAWYRLAAERGTKEFVQVRDQVLRSLDEAERAESDRQFIELRKQYSDLVLLARAIREDYEELGDRTGSRLSAGASRLSASRSVVVVDMGSSGSTSGAGYYGRIEQRLLARMDYIAQYEELGISDKDIETFNLSAIEQKIDTYLERLD
jgi:hypothetical protein